MPSGDLLITWLDRLAETKFAIETAAAPTRITSDGVVVAIEGEILIGLSTVLLKPDGVPATEDLVPVEDARFAWCATELEEDDASVVDGLVLLGPDVPSLRGFAFEGARECLSPIAVLEGAAAGVVVRATTITHHGSERRALS